MQASTKVTFKLNTKRRSDSNIDVQLPQSVPSSVDTVMASWATMAILEFEYFTLLPGIASDIASVITQMSSGCLAASKIDRVSGLTCLKSAITSTVGGVRFLYLGRFAGNCRQRAKLARPGSRWWKL